MADVELLELQSRKLAWVVRNVLKDEFTMEGSLQSILRGMFPSFPEPQFTDKGDMARNVEGYYMAATEAQRLTMVQKVIHVDNVCARFTEKGLRTLFTIVAPKITEAHLNVWMNSLMILRDSILKLEPCSLQLNASGSKGFYKSTGIPLPAAAVWPG